MPDASNYKPARATFDPDGNLWIDFDGVVPPYLMVTHPHLFMVEHNAPARTMLNLTGYIALVHDARS